MNVPLNLTGPNQFTADAVGIPAPDCGGGSPYIDQNTGMWDCTAPPAASTSQSGSASVLIFAGVVAGLLFWKYGQDWAGKAKVLLS